MSPLVFWLGTSGTVILTINTDTLTYRADFLHISSAWGCSEGKDLGSKLGLGPRQAEADHRAREGGAGQVEGNLGPQPREVAAEPR